MGILTVGQRLRARSEVSIGGEQKKSKDCPSRYTQNLEAREMNRNLQMKLVKVELKENNVPTLRVESMLRGSICQMMLGVRSYLNRLRLL